MLRLPSCSSTWIVLTGRVALVAATWLALACTPAQPEHPVAGVCVLDADCAAGELCMGGRCHRLCSSDEHCAPNEHCVDELCAPRECRDSCGSLGYACGVRTMCGRVVDCGGCGAELVCDGVAARCVACLGAEDCTLPAGYDPACAAPTCSSSGCGVIAKNDGAGCTAVDGSAGTCTIGACVSSTCNEPRADAVVCSDAGRRCGQAVDACGGLVDCGGCAVGEICDATGQCECVDQCTPGDYPRCAFHSTRAYVTECVPGPSGCYEIVETACAVDETCFPAEQGCRPAAPTEADSRLSICDAAADQTIDSSPADPAGDQGIVYDPSLPFERGLDAACCGDDPNEWYLFQQNDPLTAACCDAEWDCVDDDGVCHSSDVHGVVSTSHGTSDQLCYANWWYTCRQDLLCAAHNLRAVGEPLPELTYDCYVADGEFYWDAYATPPAEDCTDGLDNDCDGYGDVDDPDCALACSGGCPAGSVCSAAGMCECPGTDAKYESPDGGPLIYSSDQPASPVCLGATACMWSNGQAALVGHVVWEPLGNTQWVCAPTTIRGVLRAAWFECGEERALAAEELQGFACTAVGGDFLWLPLQ